MVSPQFTALVTELRDRYLSAWAGDEEADDGPTPVGSRLEREFAAERGVLPLGMEYFVEYYLHPAGRLVRFNTFFDEVEDEPDDPWSLAYGLRIGSKRYPELAGLLPPAPSGATPCAKCGGSGQVPGDENWTACWECNGLGWLPPGLGSLIERTAAALRAAADRPDEVTALGRGFVAEAVPIVGATRPALSYLDVALHRAGFDKKRVVEVGDAVAALVRAAE